MLGNLMKIIEEFWLVDIERFFVVIVVVAAAVGKERVVPDKCLGCNYICDSF